MHCQQGVRTLNKKKNGIKKSSSSGRVAWTAKDMPLDEALRGIGAQSAGRGLLKQDSVVLVGWARVHRKESVRILRSLRPPKGVEHPNGGGT